MPSLLEAHKLSRARHRSASTGPNMEGLFDKLDEETSELRQYLQEFPAPRSTPGRPPAWLASGRQTVPERCENV